MDILLHIHKFHHKTYILRSIHYILEKHAYEHIVVITKHYKIVMNGTKQFICNAPKVTSELMKQFLTLKLYFIKSIIIFTQYH